MKDFSETGKWVSDYHYRQQCHSKKYRGMTIITTLFYVKSESQVGNMDHACVFSDPIVNRGHGSRSIFQKKKKRIKN